MALHHGGRFDGVVDWAKIINVYLTITGATERTIRWVDRSEFNSNLYDDMMQNPSAVAFRDLPRSGGKPVDVLLDALDCSPIVVWPMKEAGPSDQIADLIERHWSDLPTKVLAARRASIGERVGPLDLGQLRVVWEDKQWLELAKRMALYRSAG